MLAATPARAEEVYRWRPMIEEASTRFGIQASWIERVMQAESRGYTTLNGRPIRSRAGAMGLMQLMPATWMDMRMRLGLGTNPDDPRDNILAGTFFLRLMYDRFGYPGLFGAYNAGPAAYAAWLAGTRRLPGETVAYLDTVGSTSQPMSLTTQSAAPPPLFVVRRTVSEDRSSPTASEPQASLFAVRNVAP
nr:lytic transglycosylase domain-containing protein [Novosphingobium flavum]